MASACGGGSRLAAITDPAVPYTRRSFSPLHAKGRDLLRPWFAEADLAVRLDTAANLIGRREGVSRDCVR